jgi:hypothetical protein
MGPKERVVLIVDKDPEKILLTRDAIICAVSNQKMAVQQERPRPPCDPVREL